MTTGWIWIIWTVAMLGLAYTGIVREFGPYEVIIFMGAALLVSFVAVTYERSLHPTKP